MIDTVIMPGDKKGPGRPRRRFPAERVHVSLGIDVMDALRNDVSSSGRSYSRLIEQILIAHYQRANQIHKKEII